MERERSGRGVCLHCGQLKHHKPLVLFKFSLSVQEFNHFNTFTLPLARNVKKKIINPKDKVALVKSSKL